MRRTRAVRELRLVHAAVGTAALAIPATAAAVGGSPPHTASPTPAQAVVSIRVQRHARDAHLADRVTVRGRLAPREPGRRVRLQERSGGGWRTVASSRTGARGGFKLRFQPVETGSRRLRVELAGGGNDARLAAATGTRARRVTAGAGVLTVYRQSVASWYYDGGSTACGFHAHYGVANLSLPCGTKVSFSYGSRTVAAVVDDRGPYVGGRQWDLNQNTAAALGFAGVQTVWSSR